MEDKRASYSWWCESHKSPQPSQWLRTTLSDLDEKTKSMLTLIQEDGDTFAQRAEMYYKKRPEIIRTVEEFYRSYRSLAEKYDQLRSDLTHAAQSRSSSSSNSFKQVQQTHNTWNRVGGSSEDYKLDAGDSHPESVVEDPDQCDNPDSSAKVTDKLRSTQPGRMKTNSGVKIGHNEGRGICSVLNGKEDVNMITGFKLNRINGDFPMSRSKREKIWPEDSELKLQVSKLMEENLRQQTELIRRNDEKREAIKDLCFQIDRLLDENKALQSCLKVSKAGMKKNHSQISRWKGLLLRKFLGGDSP